MAEHNLHNHVLLINASAQYIRATGIMLAGAGILLAGAGILLGGVGILVRGAVPSPRGSLGGKCEELLEGGTGEGSGAGAREGLKGLAGESELAPAPVA